MVLTFIFIYRSKVGKGYLAVQFWQKKPNGLRLALGTHHACKACQPKVGGIQFYDWQMSPNLLIYALPATKVFFLHQLDCISAAIKTQNKQTTNFHGCYLYIYCSNGNKQNLIGWFLNLLCSPIAFISTIYFPWSFMNQEANNIGFSW